MYSAMSDRPGPEVEVIARAPIQPAPTAMPTPAISSSAWTMATVSFPVSGSDLRIGAYSRILSDRLEAGVIGYQPTTPTPP